MFKIFKTCKAQVIFAEYVITFVLVVVTVMAMTFYVRRVAQARIRDTSRHMVTQIRATAPVYTGNIWYQYEPYYANSAATRDQQGWSQGQLLPHFGGSGIFRQSVIEDRGANSVGTQLPPKDAK